MVAVVVLYAVVVLLLVLTTVFVDLLVLTTVAVALLVLTTVDVCVLYVVVVAVEVLEDPLSLCVRGLPRILLSFLQVTPQNQMFGFRRILSYYYNHY